MPVDLAMDFSPLGDDLVRTYVSELKAVENDGYVEIGAFILKWGEIWTRRFSGKLEPAVLPVVDAQVIECLHLNRETLCPHMAMKRPKRCTGMRILLPELFVIAAGLVKEFQIPYNLMIYRLVTAGSGTPTLQ